MNQLYNMSSNTFLPGSGGAAGLGNGGSSLPINNSNNKKQLTHKMDSLFSMAMYDMGSTQLSAVPPKHPSQFYPVEEYKDLSLREILDLSEECLFSDDDEEAEPSAPLPFSATSGPAPSTVSSSVSNDRKSAEDLEWSQLEDPPMIASSEDIPVAAALVSSMDSGSSGRKRSRDLLLDEDSASLDEESDEAGAERRFRPYQTGQWSEKFEELCAYRKANGHCLVPHTYKENLPLARWVKRQRYQYKLMKEGKSSTMTEERVKALEDIDFVWDSQGAAWGERLSELKAYRNAFYHCNVPSNYSENPQLATWVKCQRRQYKLHMEGKPSNMTVQRIKQLDSLGFEWELRSYKKQRTL